MDVVVYPIDDDVIDIAANLYSELRKIGKTIGDADVLIAATVIRNDGVLVSNNRKHYENIKGLKLVNWL